MSGKVFLAVSVSALLLCISSLELATFASHIGNDYAAVPVAVAAVCFGLLTLLLVGFLIDDVLGP